MCVLSCSVVSDSSRPHGLWLTRFFHAWGFSRQECWSGLLCPPPGDLPNPRIKTRCPSLQADSLPSKPPGKPMNTNTGVGSLFLFLVDFLTQESNLGLLHCRWILYHLSHQGSPKLNFYNERSYLWDTTFLAVPAN